VPELSYTVGDTDPPLEADLEAQDPDAPWGPFDLTGKPVRLLGQNRRTGRRFGGDAAAVGVVPVGGVTPTRVRYQLQPGDLSDPGSYIYQFEVMAPNGATRTIPAGNSWLEFEVGRKLG
jgi:hypothetical protein